MKWMSKIASKVRALRVIADKRAVSRGLTDMVAGLFLLGSVLPGAIVMLSNSTAYTGADSNVTTFAVVALPILALVGVIGYLTKR